VISKNDRTLSFIDPVVIKEIARIPIPGGPHELAVSADNRFAYLANYYQADQKLGHSISVIDVAARREIRKIELGALEMLHGIVESGGKFYFTSEQTRTVARFNTANDSVDWIRGTGQSLTHIPVVSPDGKRLYATNMNSDSVTMIDIEGSGQDAAAIKQIAVGGKPEGIAVSPDGKELWIGQNGDGGISIIDTTTLTVKKTFKAGTMPIRIKFTADGKRVVAVDPRTSEVIVYEAARAQELKRIPVPGGPVSFAFSPDEKQIAVSLLNIAKAAIVDLENAKVLGTIPVGNVPDGIIWVKTSRGN
ncbi:MAG TPA: YncE family protein, partial [Pyrinomonadaceae bacterium]